MRSFVPTQEAVSVPAQTRSRLAADTELRAAQLPRHIKNIDHFISESVCICVSVCVCNCVCVCGRRENKQGEKGKTVKFILLRNEKDRKWISSILIKQVGSAVHSATTQCSASPKPVAT